MAVSRPYIHWLDMAAGTIRAESPVSGSYWDFYKPNGSGWVLITTKSVTGTQIDITLTDLSITGNTELMVRQRDAVTRSPDSNVMSIIVENWTESTSYTVSLVINYDTIRRIANSSQAKFDTFRTVIAGKIVNFDTLRNIRKNYSISYDTKRRVSNKVLTIADTLRKVITSGNITVNIDTLRKVIKNVSLVSDSKRLITKTVQNKLDTLRGITNSVQSKFDTLRIVISENMQIFNVDTVRQVIKSVSTNIDTKRRIANAVEFFIDTLRIIKIINLSDINPKYTFLANARNFVFKAKEKVLSFKVRK